MNDLLVKLLIFITVALLTACSAFAKSGERPRYNEYYPESLQHMSASAYYDDKAQIALLRAAADGDVKAMEQAVKDGADVNRIGRDGMAPLYWVMAQGSLTGTQWLLQNGADPNRYTKMPKAWRSIRESAMSLAIDLENPVFLHALLEHGGDANQVPWRDSSNLLFGPITFRRLQTIRLLIKYGANVNYQDKYGDTPLHQALYTSKFDIALILLQAGADPTIKDHYGDTAVAIIQRNGMDQSNVQKKRSRQAYPKMIRLLQQRGYIPKSFKYDPEHPDRTWPKDAKP